MGFRVNEDVVRTCVQAATFKGLERIPNDFLDRFGSDFAWLGLDSIGIGS
jgi:hypothetical protein